MSYLIRFFSGRTRQQVAEYEIHAANRAAELEFTQGVNGSASGSFVMEVNSENSSLLDSIDRNTHYVAIYKDGGMLVGGVTESCVNYKGSMGMKKISFYGFWEYLDEISLYSSFKSGAFGEAVRVRGNDTSWNKRIEADTPMMLFAEIFRELRSNLNDHGISPFWELGSLGSAPSEVGLEMAKSYELNSTEFPTVQSIVSELLEDEECDPFSLITRVDGGFHWVIGFNFQRYDRTIDLAVDDVGELEFEDHLPSTSARSFTKTPEAENGTFYISNVPYNTDAAYSTYVPNDSTMTVRGNRIARANKNAVRNEANIAGQVRYQTFNQFRAEVGYEYTLTAPSGASLVGVCVERSFSSSTGRFEGVLTLTSTSSQLNRFRTPYRIAEAGRYIAQPLKGAANNARKSALRGRGGTTGWRNR